MKRLLVFLAVMLAAWPAASRPRVSGPTSARGDMTYTLTFAAGDTEDSEAIGVRGFCSVRFQQSGGDDVSLYAVTTAETAASSGTLIGAFTASTTAATTFIAGTRWVKAVATDATAGGSVMVIDCAPMVGLGGGANTPFDSDGDGNVDSIAVRGDYNADGLVSPQDIWQANADLFSAAGVLPKVIEVHGGPYTMDGETFDWEVDNGFIELNTNTTLVCAGDVTIEGFAAVADYDGFTATKMVTNKVAGSTDITVAGCKFSSPAFSSPYDSSALSSQIHYGIHFDDVKRVKVLGNDVVGANHSCIYIRDSVDAKVQGNRVKFCGGVMEHGGDTSTISGALSAGDTSLDLQSGDCTSWTCAVGNPIVVELDNGDWHHADVISVSTDTLGFRPPMPSAAADGNTVFRVETGTIQNGIYFYSEDINTVRPFAANNIVDMVAGIGLHMRPATNAVWFEDLMFRDNTVLRTVGVGVNLAGVRNATIHANTFIQTGGMEFYDDSSGEVDYCYAASPNVWCSDRTTITNNVWKSGRYKAPNTVAGAIRWNRGHSNVVFKSNVVDGTVDGNCFSLVGPSPGSIIQDNSLMNCGGDGFTDGLTIGVAVTSPLSIKGLSIRDVGLSDINTSDSNAIRIDLAHTALSFDGLNIAGCTDDCVASTSSNASSGLTFNNFYIDATRSGFLGRFTEATAPSCNAFTESRWFITTDASSTTDCNTASGTGSTENACYCTGGTLTDFGSPTPLHKAIEFVRSTAAQDDLTFTNGIVRNVPNAQDAIRIQGSGAVNRPVFRNIYCSNDGPGRRSTDPLATCLRIDATTVTAANIAGVNCGANATACMHATDIDLSDTTEMGPYSIIHSTQAPSGTCVGANGAIAIDSDAAGGSVFFVCENGAWDAKD